jgi:hypothetical protein
MIVLTLFGFDTSIPLTHLLSKVIIRLFEKYTLLICQFLFGNENIVPFLKDTSKKNGMKIVVQT